MNAPSNLGTVHKPISREPTKVGYKNRGSSSSLRLSLKKSYSKFNENLLSFGELQVKVESLQSL